jgi:hypothetical protein
MSKIFLSYRRADSQDITNHLYAELRRAFGRENVFKDINTIRPGADFRLAIDQALHECRVALVMIGPSWASIADQSGRPRLFSPEDWVMQEVAAVLGRRDVTVIPVLVGGASMPSANQLPPRLKQLAYRNAYILHSDLDFQHDIEQLIAEITRAVPRLPRDQTLSTIPSPAPATGTPPGYVPQPVDSNSGKDRRASRRLWALLAAAALVLLVGAVLGLSTGVLPGLFGQTTATATFTPSPTPSRPPVVGFKVAATRYSQDCSGGNATLPAFDLTLDNTGSNVDIAWQVDITAKDSRGVVWATASPTSGSVLAGRL